ncbi:isochorismatase family protein [Pseudomonas akapageensis]|uniref:isochorismatase family protein n=1 Tax=Pseudomonas akapageensis TaxID=2609961 RepID=UPI0014076076|nr:isochorismatase family protein [Pseudomonas akapageensis]
MSHTAYPIATTAYLLVDPYNDFLSEGGKVYPHIEPIAAQVGLLANTCIESTARYASELGYHVTLVRDATAAFRHEMMHAAHELNGPTFAHSIVDTRELLLALQQH